jgi:hypothetical protein
MTCKLCQQVRPNHPGKRFLSRLNQICYVVQLKGTDRRIEK